MRVTIRDLMEMKARGEKIAMMTAYDYTSAKLLEAAGVPIILVGDSLGHVVLGYDSTVPVSMGRYDPPHQAGGARNPNGPCRRRHAVHELPGRLAEAVRNAGLLLKDGGAQSVKLEGGRHTAETVRRVVEAGIPVMGHIGLTPQSVNQLSGYRVQGKTSKAAVSLIEDARALEEAGAYAVVLESVPVPLSAMITERLSIPTIGIGAGVNCDGQVQVFHDLLGLFTDFVPKHTRRYATLADVITDAVTRYVQDVGTQAFPTDKESHPLSRDVLDELTGQPAVESLRPPPASPK